MPRVCTICSHPKRKAIDRALIDGESNRRIAARCAVSEQAVRRHREHIPATLAKAHDAAEVVRADDLLGKVQTLESTARRIGARAEAKGDLRTALDAVGKLVKVVELLGKVTGELNDKPQVNVQVGVGVAVARMTDAELRAHARALLAREDDQQGALGGDEHCRQGLPVHEQDGAQSEVTQRGGNDAVMMSVPGHPVAAHAAGSEHRDDGGSSPERGRDEVSDHGQRRGDHDEPNESGEHAEEGSTPW